MVQDPKDLPQAVQAAQIHRLSEEEYAIVNMRSPKAEVAMFTLAEIEAFIGGCKDGDFDHFLT